MFARDAHGHIHDVVVDFLVGQAKFAFGHVDQTELREQLFDLADHSIVH